MYIRLKKPGKYSMDYGGRNEESGDSNIKCFSCGGSWPHKGGKSKCPAFQKRCHKCQGMNHFSKLCRSREPAIKQVLQDSDSSDDQYVFHITDRKSVNKIQSYITVHVNKTPIRMQIDSGADVNILDEKTYNLVQHNSKLKPTKLKLYSYGSSSPLKLLGKVSLLVASKNSYDVADFFVTKGGINSGSLLGCATASKLGILKIVNNINQNNKVDSLIKEFDDLFHGIGKMKDLKVKLHIDPSVKPVAQKHRRIPFNVREKLEKELERLERAGIIENVYTATDWVSPIVLVPKRNSSEIRMCVDMREANKAIKRTRHVIPTIDEIRHELNGSTVYSKLDLNKGFHQLELDENSRSITTFSTHVGLKSYCRLNFGTSSATEIFHEELRKKLIGIKGVKNIHDDIIVAGIDEEDHLRALKETFQILRENGLTLNKSKCEFNKSSIDFFGYVFTQDGIIPDPNKVEALKLAEPPKSQTEMRSFLGMNNYCAQFIPGYATITAPLRYLTHKNVHWKWSGKHQQAFNEIRDILSNETLLRYYIPQLDTEIICDASPVGVGAILVQYDKDERRKQRIISYNSRSLTDTEKRYSQIEREALAILYGCQKFQLYLLGQDFTVITDHKPLEALFNNPSRPGPFRVERIRLRLQGFSFKVKYRQGKNNPSDYISRHPLPLSCSSKSEIRESSSLEAHVHFIINTDIPDAIDVCKIQEETGLDETLKCLKDHLINNTLNSMKSKLLEPFKKIKEELSIANGVILRGSRIIIPKSLQEKIVKIAHEGHLGIVKTKQFLRSRVWFPGLDKLVEQIINNCIPCQASINVPVKEPMQITEIPNGPWEILDTDYYGPLPSGEYILTVIDEYSRFPEIEFTTSTSAKATIPKLDRIISTFGIPLEIKSDNGPPFNSEEFAKYASFMGFRHRQITPRYPEANGLAENFNKILKKVISTSKVENKNWRQEIYKCLRNYRATKHTTTGMSPAELVFQKRLYKTRLPEIIPTYEDSEVKSHDTRQKEVMKRYADRKCYIKYNNLKPGDLVLVRNENKRKDDTFYKAKPHQVIERKGNMITARCQETGHIITRNISFFKRLRIHDKLLNAERNSSSLSELSNEDSDDENIVSNDGESTNEENDISDLSNEDVDGNFDLSNEDVEVNKRPRRNKRKPLRFITV